MEVFDVLPGGLYALTQAEPGERVVAWVRATPAQSWCPVGAFDGSGHDSNRAAAIEACREHYRQMRAKRGA